MDGGVPAGIFARPLTSGDLQKSVKIRPITSSGKRRTRASGIETVESPFRRMRRRKKAAGTLAFSARWGASSFFSALSVEGCDLLVASWRCSIWVTGKRQAEL